MPLCAWDSGPDGAFVTRLRESYSKINFNLITQDRYELADKLSAGQECVGVFTTMASADLWRMKSDYCNLVIAEVLRPVQV